MRFRKGELNFYKSLTPKEIKELLKLVSDKKYLYQFLEMYRYNYKNKQWVLNEE